MNFRRMIQTEPGLLKFTGNVDQRITADPERYGFDAERATQYATTRGRFAADYATYNEDVTHSTPFRVAKDDSKRRLINATADLVEQVYANKSLSDQVRQELGLPPRDRRGTPAATATEAPLVMGVVRGATGVKVIGRDAADPSRRGKPAGMRQLAVATCFSDDRPGVDGPWEQARLSGRTTVDLDFPHLRQAAVLWVTCWWISSRNEPGPMSIPVAVRLSGTGAGMPAREGEGTATADAPGMKIAA